MWISSQRRLGMPSRKTLSPLSDAEFCDTIMKMILDIQSKRELDVDGPKAVAFDQMLASFDYRDRA